ncbi:hypothetical protein IDJ77_16830 [Mucilaginibacter sp. ZT4R22]|uniref:Uncharacterized protein n=1 Tax=Mucilaginibacter pankratovii TaxID=2772110 RepID=A0ABR7WV97_9SPHI|nr:hypothetical protein [Mucilaginibacter pankratovii]MBD1365482.1 hypothetical protein [Mucilaginibacter pankratovii]
MKLLHLSLLIVTMLTGFNSFGQKKHNIKFIYYGPETKPVGTILISVEKAEKTIDKPFDAHFGSSVKTDMGTYNAISRFLKEKKYTASTVKPNYVYKVIDSDGFSLTVYPKDCPQFFHDLLYLIEANHLDRSVSKALE